MWGKDIGGCGVVIVYQGWWGSVLVGLSIHISQASGCHSILFHRTEVIEFGKIVFSRRRAFIIAMDNLYLYGCLILNGVESGRIELTRYKSDRVATCKAWQHDEVSHNDLLDWLVPTKHGYSRLDIFWLIYERALLLAQAVVSYKMLRRRCDYCTQRLQTTRKLWPGPPTEDLVRHHALQCEISVPKNSLQYSSIKLLQISGMSQ